MLHLHLPYMEPTLPPMRPCSPGWAMACRPHVLPPVALSDMTLSNLAASQGSETTGTPAYRKNMERKPLEQQPSKRGQAWSSAPVNAIGQPVECAKSQNRRYLIVPSFTSIHTTPGISPCMERMQCAYWYV